MSKAFSGNQSAQLQDSKTEHNDDSAGPMAALSSASNAMAENEDLETLVKALAELMKDKGLNPNILEDWKKAFGMYAGNELVLNRSEAEKLVKDLAKGKHIPWLWRQAQGQVVSAIFDQLAGGANEFGWDVLAPTLTDWLGTF